MTRWLGREHVEEALRDLSDESLQRQLWLSADSPASFEDCLAQLWDDSALGDVLDRGPVFGEPTDTTLRLLHRAVRQVSRHGRADADVLGDPLMVEVRRLAADALASLGRG